MGGVPKMHNSAVKRSYYGTSLPPGVHGKKKGELVLQLQRIDWDVTPPDFRSGCSLSIHWWGQSPSDNMVLVIPDCSCPPPVTTVYPLVSSKIQLCRYLQDMVALDLCLVAGMQSKEEFGVRMANFSIMTNQLSDSHPIQHTIPIFEKNGAHLASLTINLSLVYDPETVAISATDMLILDALASKTIEIGRAASTDSPSSLCMKEGADAAHRNLSQGEEEADRPFAAQLKDTFIKGKPMISGSSDRRKMLYMDFDDPLASKGNQLPDSANSDPLSSRKPMIMDFEVRSADGRDILGSTVPRFPRQHLILDVEVPHGNRTHLSSSSRRTQLVMDVDVPSITKSQLSRSSLHASPRIGVIDGDYSSLVNLSRCFPDIKLAMGAATIPSTLEIPSRASSRSSTTSATVSPRKKLKSDGRTAKKPRGEKLLPRKDASPNGRRLQSSPAKLRYQRPSSNQVKDAGESSPPVKDAKGARRQLPKGKSPLKGGIAANEIPETGNSSQSQSTPHSGLEKLVKTGKNSLNIRARSEDTQNMISNTLQKLPIPGGKSSRDSTKRSKKARTNSNDGSSGMSSPRNRRTSGRSSRASTPRDGKGPMHERKNIQDYATSGDPHQWDIHLDLATRTSAGGDASLDYEVFKKQSLSDRHRLSGNLAILPDESAEKLDPESTGRSLKDLCYTESLQKLVHQIVTFRTTLTRSAFHSELSPIATDENKNKTSTLIENFRNLDDSIGSVNRLLTSLSAESKLYDLPQYARVGQREILDEDPADVAKAALLEELFLSHKNPDEPRERRESKAERPTRCLEDSCYIHNEFPPKKQVFWDGLPLRFRERKQIELKSKQPQPHLESIRGLHGDTQRQSDKSFELNLSMNLKVGKLVLAESTLKCVEGFVPAFSSEPASWTFKQGLKTSSSMLTVSFPGLNSSALGSTPAPGQSITISPTKQEMKEVDFGHESQLHWKGVKVKCVELWKPQRLIVRASMSWDSGQSVICEGSFVLKEVFDSMSKGYRTKLNLYRARQCRSASEFKAAHLSVSPYEAKAGVGSFSDESASVIDQMETIPAAEIEIAIDLLVDDLSGKPKMGHWLYVTISSITGSKLQPEDEKSGHLVFVVKSDLQTGVQIPYLVNWQASNRQEVETWRPLRGSHPDAVLRGPKQMETATLFIEVWRDSRAKVTEASSKFIGLVKVPLSSSSLSRKQDRGHLVAEGEYYTWNPFKDVICGTIQARVVQGTEEQMIKFQQEDRAARIIQGHVYRLRDTRRGGKDKPLSFIQFNPFNDLNFPRDYTQETRKHVVEVIVQHVTDLPECDALNKLDSARCEGAFIKYISPCDEEPFYTQASCSQKFTESFLKLNYGNPNINFNVSEQDFPLFVKDFEMEQNNTLHCLCPSWDHFAIRETTTGPSQRDEWEHCQGC